MVFRNREAERVFGLRHQLFSQAASDSLRDRHHLGKGHETENMYSGIRSEVAEFFSTRKIKWHGNASCDSSIVSSQVACVNLMFPFTSDPIALKGWLSSLYPDLSEVLPISSKAEPPLPNGSQPFLTFEWIGERNYLNEPGWGRRGQNCTSMDVIFRFRTAEGEIHIVLAEWKYCESDEEAEYKRRSDRGTDRVAIYRPHLTRRGSQLSLEGVDFEDLFFNPLDQCMRQQLLASAMEREREMDADVVSVLHISPRSNEGLLNFELSRKVAPGKTVGEVWSTIAAPGRFRSIMTEDLMPHLVQSGVDPAWSTYVENRYGAIGKSPSEGNSAPA
ncbi:MAG: hypothetical protein LC114_03635 [Bryobacterales bacterium]|nr:hypothetical protein [Bryobacterales bacterium]